MPTHLWSKRTVVVALACLTLGSLAAAQAPTYFVQADMVRSAQGAMGPVCVPNSVFFGGERIIFRAIVYDAATGEQLSFDQIQELGITATVHIDGVEPIDMFYPPPEAFGAPDGPPPGTEYFRGPWGIPVDYAPGMYGWGITVTDAQGNAVDFTPIGASAGLNDITIQPPAN